MGLGADGAPWEGAAQSTGIYLPGGRNCTEHRARGFKHEDPSGLWMVLCLEGPEGHFNPGTMKGGMVVDFSPLYISAEL